jgi:hypothetical protein
MKEKSKVLILRLLLVILISFFILVVSVSASSVALHTWNNHYSAKITNNNNLVFLEDGEELWSQKIDYPIRSIAISPNGQYTAVGCDGGVIYFFENDWSVTLVWRRSFGDASITSVSFQENGNFLEASDTFNHAFLITRTGNLVSESRVTASATLSSVSRTSATGNTGANDIFWSNYFIWIVIAVLGLIFFGAIISGSRKAGSTSTYQPLPNNGSIHCDSIPPGADIYLDGVYTGVAPFTIWALNPGTYRLRASLNGYDSDTQLITISAGQTFVYSPTLKKIYSPPVQPQSQVGTISTKVIPTGSVYIDDVWVGISPVTISNVKPGNHILEARWDGYYPNVQQITITAGQTFVYSPSLRKLPIAPSKPEPQPPSPFSSQKISFQNLITHLGAKTQEDREEAQKQLIIKVNTEGKPAIQQIIKELEKQPSGVKREIVNLLYYLSKESHDGQKVTEELILALTYSSSEVKWLIVQTLGRLKDKRALSAIEAATLDTDFLVKYWAIISLKNIQES